jgi:hypothetical protein
MTRLSAPSDSGAALLDKLSCLAIAALLDDVLKNISMFKFYFIKPFNSFPTLVDLTISSLVIDPLLLLDPS